MQIYAVHRRRDAGSVGARCADFALAQIKKSMESVMCNPRAANAQENLSGGRGVADFFS
jgi:hypothetical protein